MLTASLLACKLDTSGSGTGDDSETSGTSAGSAESSPTSAPTVTSAETATEPTTADTSASTTPGTTSATTDDDSTGGLELGPFGDITPLDELNSAGIDDDPCMSIDLLEIYFGSDRAGPGEDIWRATRASADDPFDAPEAVDEISLPNTDETTPELGPGGLTLFFASNRPGVGALDIYVSTRGSRGEAWGAPALVEDLSTMLGEGAPVLADDLTAYLCRSGAAGPTELFRGTRVSVDDPWELVLLEPFNSELEDCSPWIVANEGELWLSSTREGGAGDYDVWHAPVVDGVPGTPENVAELNTQFGEDDPWLSPDGLTLLFASNRDGTYDLFIATRSLR